MSNNPLSLAPIVPNTDPAHRPGPEPVTGRHVTLERLEQKHFSDLYENVGRHADLWTWWPDEPPSTPSAFDEYVEQLCHYLADDLAVYAAIPLAGPHEGKAAGIAFALSQDRLTNRVGELGLFLGPPLQGSRAGTEVAYLLAGLLFDLNHRRLQWKTNALNTSSRRAAERYGFVHEGTFRQDQINKGRNRDSAWYSIIDSEWPVCKQAFELWLEDGNFDEQQRQKRRIEEIRATLKA